MLNVIRCRCKTFTISPPALAALRDFFTASGGLLVTFAAGLWNIGIEGQVVMGAVFATGLMQALQHSLPPAARRGIQRVLIRGLKALQASPPASLGTTFEKE